jgi:GT2 family glycosyltransferase
VKISVIIVNYNTRDDLRACLSALRQQTIPAEVIVVDNASTDGSAAMVREVFPEVRLIEPGHNTWFCRGNNLGIAQAAGEYALLLNPDTVPPPNALETLIAFMDAHPEYAGATLRLHYPDGQVQRTCSRIATYRYLLLTQTPLGWLLRAARRRAEDWHWYAGWERDRDFDIEAIPGSCTLMRRADLRLDEDLRLYFNEDDLARRHAGQKFRFLAAPSVLHREKAATRTARASQIYFQDLITYTRKHHGRARAVLLWLCSRPLAWAIQLRWRLRRA